MDPKDVSSNSASPAWPRVGAWAFVVVGATHLLVMGATFLSPLPVEQQALLTTMSRVPVAGLGVERSFAQLYFGFSGAMAVFVLGYGLAMLELTRRAPQLLGPRSPLGWLSFGLAALGFAIAVASFPTPPVVVLGFATLAFGRGLIARAAAV